MTDQADQNEGQGEVNSQDQKPQEVDSEKLMAELEKLKATNQRLLDESVQYKNKYKEVKESVEKQTKQKLEEEENFKALYEQTEKKFYETQNQLNDYKKQILKKDLAFKVANVAKDAYDIDDVLNRLPREMLKIDEETGEVSGVDEAVSYLKEKKWYLFNQQKNTGMSDQRPKNDSGKKSWKDLEKHEKDKLFKDSLSEWL